MHREGHGLQRDRIKKNKELECWSGVFLESLRYVGPHTEEGMGCVGRVYKKKGCHIQKVVLDSLR